MKLDNLFLRVGTGLFLAAQLTACGDNGDEKKKTNLNTEEEEEPNQELSWKLTKIERSTDPLKFANGIFPLKGTFTLKEGKTDNPKVGDEIELFMVFKGTKKGETVETTLAEGLAVKAKVKSVESNDQKVILNIPVEEAWTAADTVLDLAKKVLVMKIQLAKAANKPKENEIHEIDTGNGTPLPQNYKFPVLDSADLAYDANTFTASFYYTDGLKKAAFNDKKLKAKVTLTAQEGNTDSHIGSWTLAEIELKLDDDEVVEFEIFSGNDHLTVAKGDITSKKGNLGDQSITKGGKITGIKIELLEGSDVIATIENEPALDLDNRFTITTP